MVEEKLLRNHTRKICVFSCTARRKGPGGVRDLQGLMNNNRRRWRSPMFLSVRKDSKSLPALMPTDSTTQVYLLTDFSLVIIMVVDQWRS